MYFKHILTAAAALQIAGTAEAMVPSGEFTHGPGFALMEPDPRGQKFKEEGFQMTGTAKEGEASSASGTLISNPAAEFCVEQGGTYEIRDNADGSKAGFCILADGTEIDAWQYFRQEAG